MWRRWQEYAFLCRFARQDIFEILGRKPTALEHQLFLVAIRELLDAEYASTPPELREHD